MSKKSFSLIKFFLVPIIITGFAYGWHEYRLFTAVPTERLAAGSYYPEMPPDEHHHYLQLPIDHRDPAKGTFMDFYILSPNFKPGDKVVFWLFDNQQERVGLLRDAKDFAEFENILGGLSYVLIGNRGVSPTLFPEVFRQDGSINYPLAMNLYGSAQQIEDIEAVRQDMQNKHLLPQDGNIMLYGGSGGGFLVQQYLDKYGSHVSRAIIENSGAPDLAQQHKVPFAKSFYEANPDAANMYYALSSAEVRLSLAYLLFKLGQEGEVDLQLKIVKGQSRSTSLQEKYSYFSKWIKPANNFPLIRFMLGIPAELEVKVRIYELLGADLKNYQPTSPEQVILMYEWTKVILADFLKAEAVGEIRTPAFPLHRSNYSGEVLVWSGLKDQAFSEQMAQWINASYPRSKRATFDDGHRLMKSPEYYRELRKAFFATGLSVAH
ncbi:hypothetical protein EV210_12627 [Anaerospora hongkongensis]|uniref:Secretory lipase n=1 Tax=Anaerospora hongkongensis TaxID=244830 RepID=A0A4V2Q7H3_9FIRM|nr:hypothetical protein [Anaerospora hongkongensis]TCL31815.1 hypothetical protein EV210_12627 [Anaerospora hongkongensis]